MLINSKPFQSLANSITAELRYDFKSANTFQYPLLFWANKGLDYLCSCDVDSERLILILNDYK